jgi:hypothetical protein
MSINYKNKESDIKKKKFTDLGYGIKVQCPDCGTLFVLDEYKEYFCKRCDRIYLEEEIRARCGI